MTNEELYKLWIEKGQGMKALKYVYQQGRADAIDEFISNIEKDAVYEHPIELIEVDRCRYIARMLKGDNDD